MTVYYDGLCRGCSVAADTMRTPESHIDFVDANKVPLPTGISFQDAMHDVHVVEESGTTYKGSEAILRILDEYPHWRWLAASGRLPGMRNLAAALYRIVAHNRYWLFGRKS